MNERRVAMAIKALIECQNLECASVLYKISLIFTLMYKGETTVWKEKEKLKMKNIQMYNFRAINEVRKSNRMQNRKTREVVGSP